VIARVAMAGIEWVLDNDWKVMAFCFGAAVAALVFQRGHV